MLLRIISTSVFFTSFAHVVLCISGAGSVNAALLADTTECDRLYAKRPELSSLLQSVDCYANAAKKALVVQDTALRKEALEKHALAAFYAAVQPDAARHERQLTDAGLASSENLAREFPEAGSGPYWRASFRAKYCEIRDRGKLIPTTIMKYLKAIKADMRAAMDREPAYHGYGPHRIYGIMYMMMPPIVGGDDRLAEQHLELAYRQAPEFPMNHVSYARVLIEVGKKAQAKDVLESFVAMTPEQLSPELRPETLADQREARKLLTELQAP